MRPSKKTWFEFITLTIILLVVFLIWLGVAYWIDLTIIGMEGAKLETNAIEARGLFGDKFGAVNALFSGLAFAGIIFTIFLQRRDIDQTRTAFDNQNKTANHERFDSTFFQILLLHNDITSRLSDLEMEGRKSFVAFNEKIRQLGEYYPLYVALAKIDREAVRQIRDTKSLAAISPDKLSAADRQNIEVALKDGPAGCDNFLDESLEMHERIIKNTYTKAASEHIDSYSQYFRNLYHLLKFIRDSKLIDESEKLLYIKIVRSQLSEPELVALFYNSISPIQLPGRESMELGHPKMGNLLSDFDILQNMSPRSIFHPAHRNIFEKNNPRSKV